MMIIIITFWLFLATATCESYVSCEMIQSLFKDKTNRGVNSCCKKPANTLRKDLPLHTNCDNHKLSNEDFMTQVTPSGKLIVKDLRAHFPENIIGKMFKSTEHLSYRHQWTNVRWDFYYYFTEDGMFSTDNDPEMLKRIVGGEIRNISDYTDMYENPLYPLIPKSAFRYSKSQNMLIISPVYEFSVWDHVTLRDYDPPSSNAGQTDDNPIVRKLRFAIQFDDETLSSGNIFQDHFTQTGGYTGWGSLNPNEEDLGGKINNINMYDLI